jgi:hypothetical protein
LLNNLLVLAKAGKDEVQITAAAASRRTNLTPDKHAWRLAKPVLVQKRADLRTHREQVIQNAYNCNKTSNISRESERSITVNPKSKAN